MSFYPENTRLLLGFAFIADMVSKYKRKSTRQCWEEADMQRAIEAINNQEMGWLKASRTFNVPQATLRRRAGNRNKIITGSAKGLGRFQTSLSKEAEEQLVEYMLDLESRLFGLTTTETKKLAYDLAERMGFPHSFNKQKKTAGWDWLKGFRARHPELSLRSPEPTSAARAMAFNRVQVEKFFKLLDETMKKEQIPGHRIYNMDESALTTVQKPPKVFAKRGKKQVGAVTSAERGQHVTVVACMSSAGHYIPPALIFPRKNHKAELFDGCPPGTLELCHDTGYMVSELFNRWMDHFIKYAKPSKEEKVILILDGHASHTSLDALIKAKENGVVMLCLPPHCTHRLQPLDVAFFGPLEGYYNIELTTWLKNHPGRTVGLYQVSDLFSKAYFKAATIGNAVSGFKNTGINPFNPNIFPDHLFSPSDVTDTPIPSENREAANTSTASENVSEATIENLAADQDVLDHPHLSVKECLNILSPLPSVSSHSEENMKKRKRKSGGSKVLTVTPNIEEIKLKEENKREVERRKSLRENVKRKIVEPEESEDEQPGPFFDEDEDDDAACLFCNDTFRRSRPGEHWIRCQQCKAWAHIDCAGIPKSRKNYTCELCLDN